MLLCENRVTSSIELNCRIEGNDSFDVTRCRCLVLFLERRIQILHIRCVMFAVMQFHDLPGDDRLEFSVAVRQIWQRVRCDAPPLSAAETASKASKHFASDQ